MAIVSAKEDRDDLLVYKNVDLKSLERISIFGLPIDNVTRDEAVASIYDSIEEKKGSQHVLFLNPVKLMKMYFRRDLRSIAKGADLVLAEGGGLAWAAKKMKRPLKERISMIAVIMDLVRLAVHSELTIYLLGSRQECLERVFFTFQRSFPGVRIIGRQAGNFGKKQGTLIKESLRKSAPDIVFLAMDFPKQEKWITENKKNFPQTVFVGVEDTYEILSGLGKTAPDWLQLRGLSWLWQTLTRPWQLSRIFAMLCFYIFSFAVSFKNLWKSTRSPANTKASEKKPN